MNKTTLSIVLATFNEEKNIESCIKSFGDIADEVVIFDESSKDKTRQIAKDLGAKVFKTKHEAVFHKTKQKAMDKAEGEWVLQMDADERLTPELREEVETIVKKGSKYSAFYIKRKNFFVGRWMRGSGMWPDSVIRLFKRGKAFLPQKSVHEQMEVEGETSTLKNPMEHHTAPTFAKYLNNANRYTTLSALKMDKDALKINPWTAFVWVFVKPCHTFVSLFFRHKGFRDGLHGFVFDLFSALHFPIAFFKLWQMRKNPEVKDKLVNWK